MSPAKGKVTKCEQWWLSQADNSDGSRSLERSLVILTCFSSGTRVLTIADIASEIGMSELATRGCVVRLVALGYLGPESSQGYRFAARPEPVVLPTALHEYSHSYLEELCRRTLCAVSLAVLEGFEIVYLDHACSFRRGETRSGLNVGVGSRQPAYSTAMGKVLMAYMPYAQQQQLIRDLMLTKRIPGSKSALFDELEQVRNEGMAVSEEELVAIAVPVCGFYRDVVASVGVSAHASMISLEEVIGELVPQLRATADHVSVRLGYGRSDERSK